MPWTAYSTILQSLGPTPVPHHWQLDVASALIGAAVAFLFTGLAYRYRDALRQGWEAAVAPLGQWQARLQSSAEDRYRALVATRARSLVVPAGAAPLYRLCSPGGTSVSRAGLRAWKGPDTPGLAPLYATNRL